MNDIQKLETNGQSVAVIYAIRGQPVVLDADLAKLFGVETKRLNEQVKRNAARFGDKYVFRLTKKEHESLRSQFATSKSKRGGRRYPPWAFTEHGVVMAATVLNSETAVEASKLIVDVFVSVKEQWIQGGESVLVSKVSSPANVWGKMGHRLEAVLNLVLDSVIDEKKQTTVREEAQEVISQSIKNLKDRLKKTGLENEELAARATKLLAEAEKEKSIAAKTRAEANALEFENIVKKLYLLIEAHRAMSENKVDGFLEVLKELSGQ